MTVEPPPRRAWLDDPVRRSAIRFFVAISIAVAFLAAGVGFFCRPDRPAPQAVAGAMDLSDHDLEEAGSVVLRGEWEFFPSVLLGDVGEGPGVPAEVRARVPGSWNGLPDGAGGVLGAVGTGTYRLRVRLPAGIRPGEALDLWAPSARTASTLHVWDGRGGRLVEPVSVGTVSADPEGHQPRIHHQVVTFRAPASREMVLVYEVSNRDHCRGGLYKAPAIALSPGLQWERTRQDLLAAIFIGLFLYAAFHHVALYLTWPTSTAPLSIAACCVAVFVRTPFSQGLLSEWLTTPAHYELALRVEYVGLYVATATIAAMLSALFPRVLTWRMGAVVAGIEALFVVATLATDSLFYTSLVRLHGICLLALFAGATVAMVASIFQDATGLSKIVFVGGLGAFLAGVNDTLYMNGLVETGELMQVGLVFFLAAQTVVLGLVQRNTNLALLARNEQIERYNRAASRFVPDGLLAILGKSNLAELKLSDAVEAEMAILFSDIRGFTTLTESKKPLETFEFVNELLEYIGPVARERGGFVVKYMGDGVMAVFPGGAEDAVRAAIGTQEAMRRYNIERIDRGEPPVRIGIGINHGPTMLGVVGEEGRFQGDLLSDAVNLASRVEGATKNYGASILITESTYAHLPDPTRFSVREVDVVAVKGKRQPVVVYEVFDCDPQELRLQKVRTADAFADALRLYRAGRYDEARRILEAARQTAPDDGLIAMYLERCAHPPTGGGVTVLGTK